MGWLPQQTPNFEYPELKSDDFTHLSLCDPVKGEGRETTVEGILEHGHVASFSIQDQTLGQLLLKSEADT